jgi:hypothetical protein
MSDAEANGSAKNQTARSQARMEGQQGISGTSSALKDTMLRIQRSANEEVVFTVSGQMDEESIVELETLINSEAKGSRIVLDLKDLTLANEEGITFLVRCEANSITLKPCPAYVREWITAKRRES